LKQVFIVLISEELPWRVFFFFNWFGEKCAHGAEFIWDIAPNCYVRAPLGFKLFWFICHSNQNHMCKICNGLWCATTFLEIPRAKMGVLSVGLVKLIFVCEILGVSGGVQLHTWKLHMQKWVLVMLDE
jgi:hypothetical protein